MKKKLLEEYNKICKKAYEDNYEMDFKSPEFEAILTKCQSRWAQIHLKENQCSVEEFLNRCELDQIINIFQHFAEEGDFKMPKAVITAVNSHGKKGIDKLAGHAFDMMDRKDDKSVYVSIHAVKSLGRLKRKEYITKMIDYSMELPEREELFIESVIEGLMEMGPDSIDKMVDCINKNEKINNNLEYMLQALSQLGRDNRDTRIFECLKSAFLRMGKKDLGALCIAEYGDMRGIPVLTSFIEKNKVKVTRDVYFEIIHCIKALGGRVDNF